MLTGGAIIALETSIVTEYLYIYIGVALPPSSRPMTEHSNPGSAISESCRAQCPVRRIDGTADQHTSHRLCGSCAISLPFFFLVSFSAVDSSG